MLHHPTHLLLTDTAMAHDDRASLFAQLEQASQTGSRKERATALRELQAERLKDLRVTAAIERRRASRLQLIES